MTRVPTIILTFLTLLTIHGYAQNTLDSILTNTGLRAVDKKVIAEYSGGRFGFSGLSLTLYSDSSYFYTSWTHTGKSYSDKGTFTRYKSKINLRSDTVITMKGLLGPVSFTVFDNKIYRVRDNKILLYSRLEELFDRHEFYESYYTLYRTDSTSVK